MISISSGFKNDERISQQLHRHSRRVEAMPPGICPLAAQLALLKEGTLQTCGKCVPCAEGLPQMVRLLERIVAASAQEEDVARLRSLAEMVRGTADCAIGYEAAQAVLEGFDLFADEYASHIERGVCQAGMGQTVPCETMCPAHVHVPGYIGFIAQGDYAGAVAMVRKDNPFPTACGFVCEHPCEERCRRMLIDAPINIRLLKKFACDKAPADTVDTPVASVDTGRKVAVIGGGPSGLTCAYFLALMGHRVTVFEGRAQLGGMLRYGIPAYRFPRERLDEDIRGILRAGNITAHCNEKVDLSRMRELADEYSAVYVAIGAQIGKMLEIEGSDASGVVSAVELLERIGDGDYPDFAGKKVVVIGGGNVAMDCARTSIRAGAQEVSVVYRRRKEDMTALAIEIESAIAEGVEMVVLESPVSIETNNKGCCTALITQPQMIGPITRGRPAPLAANKPLRRIEADVILIAVGQDIVSLPFEEFGMKASRSRFAADEHLHAEGFENVFVGGDCQTGPATVIRGIGAGKVAARNIDSFLGYHHTLQCDVEAPDASPNDRTPRGRVEAIERPARERAGDFKGVEVEMTLEEAMQECGRCLRCDCFGPGSQEGGRLLYV